MPSTLIRSKVSARSPSSEAANTSTARPRHGSGTTQACRRGPHQHEVPRLAHPDAGRAVSRGQHALQQLGLDDRSPVNSRRVSRRRLIRRRGRSPLRRPVAGGVVQVRLAASPAGARARPTRITAAIFSPASSTRSAIVATVPRRTTSSGWLARWTTTTGQSSPYSPASSAISVARPGDREVQHQRRAGGGEGGERLGGRHRPSSGPGCGSAPPTARPAAPSARGRRRAAAAAYAGTPGVTSHGTPAASRRRVCSDSAE